VEFRGRRHRADRLDDFRHFAAALPGIGLKIRRVDPDGASGVQYGELAAHDVAEDRDASAGVAEWDLVDLVVPGDDVIVPDFSGIGEDKRPPKLGLGLR